MTRKGVWGLQQVRDKYLASLWEQSYTIWAMGQGNYGEMLNNENGDNASRSSPVQLGGTLANGWATVEAGDGCFYGTRNDGQLWVAGDNEWGQLAQNDRGTGDTGSTRRSSPTQVPGSWDYVNSGSDSIIGVKTNGTLWAWGRMQSGSLGLNQSWAAGPQTGVQGFSSPVQIGTDTTWTNNFQAGANVGAIKTDGTLWVWGSNGDGRLGLSQPSLPGQRSSPCQLPGTTWSYFANGGTSCGAIKTDGTLWMWGNNEVGELGQNNKTNYNSPRQVPGSTWSDLAFSTASSEAAVAAVKTDGTLWTWGGNEQGELGQNNLTDYSSPRQMGTGTDWKQVWGDGPEAGRNFWATKTDGTIWNWGNGNYGSLDHNLASSDTGHQFSSPTQMGTETVYSGLNKRQLSVTDRHSYVMKPLLTPSQL
tara:strand:- start:43 stop:1299 length:1257 start_codon:yes stop_codon:yes gene_type:complete